jgi:hypothetical protein
MSISAMKQEPYGYFRYDIQLDAWVQNKESTQGVAFYTSPPKREWVALTNDEIDDLWKTEYFNLHYELARAIEAKLKERNNG